MWMLGAHIIIEQAMFQWQCYVRSYVQDQESVSENVQVFVKSAIETFRNSYDYEHTTCVLIEKDFVPNNTLKKHYTGKNVN